MSVLQYSDVINASEVQIWNNATFDNGESEDSTAIKSSWWSQSLESSCSKENLNPVCEKSAVSFKSSVSSLPIKPLHSNSTIANSQGNPLKHDVSKRTFVSRKVNQEDERNIDMEIEEIEKEISRLSSRLESLRLEKVDRSLKIMERPGRIVPAKFMEQKQSIKIEDPFVSSAKSKTNRRGVSLGPAEIASGAKSRLFNKHESTPVSAQNRRKSCFWKLEEIDELKVIKERGKSFSVSPRSRKTVSKIQAQKQAVTTVGAKRAVKKEDGILASIQPKKLFCEKSVPSKKTMKPGRVVASRYSQIGTSQSNGDLTVSEARKRSLPDNEKEDCNKRRASHGNGVLGQRIDSSRVKKRSEIPNELVVSKGDSNTTEESPQSVSVVGKVLPQIKTFRCVNETPRDSGAAKRAADLVGKKSFFSTDDGEDNTTGESVCQALNFSEVLEE